MSPCALTGASVRLAGLALQVLSAIFYAFEEHPGKGVNVAEIAGGLSLLCSGNKSSKLAVS